MIDIEHRIKTFVFYTCVCIVPFLSFDWIFCCIGYGPNYTKTLQRIKETPQVTMNNRNLSLNEYIQDV